MTRSVGESRLPATTSRRTRAAFLTLILVQAAHSVEEYATRLYDRLAPARFVADLFGFDRRIGFAMFNVALVTFGLWCWFGPLRRGTSAGGALVWFWAVLEALNGAAHLIWAASAGAYRPGVGTAPLLLAAASLLAWNLGHDPPSEAGAAD